MVKIGRSLAGAADSPANEGLGDRKARPPTSSSSVPEDSQKVKVHITVALVRRGFDLQSDSRRLLLVHGDMTLREFKALACRTLGLGEDYPLRLTVVGAVSPQRGGTLMGTLYEEAMAADGSDAVLYVQH